MSDSAQQETPTAPHDDDDAIPKPDVSSQEQQQQQQTVTTPNPIPTSPILPTNPHLTLNIPPSSSNPNLPIKIMSSSPSSRVILSPTSPARLPDKQPVALRGKLRLYVENASAGFFFGRSRAWKMHYVALDGQDGVIFCTDEKSYEKGEKAMVLPFSEIASVEIKTGGLFHIGVRKESRHNFGSIVKLQATTEEDARQWTSMLHDKILLRARVYTVGLNGEFPEQARGIRPGTSICFSGGGGRAHVCASGQLSALFHLGLLTNASIDYISCVSAGAWASAIFTFWEKGADSDAHLFGPLLSQDLSKWNMETLLTQPLSPMLAPAHNDMWATASELIWVTNSHLLWEKSMGKVFLKPFGLNKDTLFCLREDEEQIKADNPQLRDTKFITPRPDRPFWIAHGTIIGPIWAKVGTMLPIQFSALYTGSPYLHKMHYHEKRREDHELDVWVGGGMVDSFAFGGDEPEGLAKPPMKRSLFASSAMSFRRDSMRLLDYATLRKTDKLPEQDKEGGGQASEHFGATVLQHHKLSTSSKKGSKPSISEEIKEAAATFNMGYDMIARVFHHSQEVFQQEDMQWGSVPKEDLDSDGVMVRTVAIPHASTPFSLRHALGISSDAPSVNLHNRQIFQRLNVQQKYWTPVAAEAIELATSGRHLKTSGQMGGSTTALQPTAAQVQHKKTMEQRRKSIAATHAITMDMGDGGSLDDSGLLGMLQRGVKRNIVFVNTNNVIPHSSRDVRNMSTVREGSTADGSRRASQLGLPSPRGSKVATTPNRAAATGGGGLDSSSPINKDVGDDTPPPSITPPAAAAATMVFDKTLPPTWEEWPDDDILPLFGQVIDEKSLNYLGTHHGHNRVFPIEGLRDLLNAFQANMDQGEPLVVEREYEVLENSFWGIEGGWKTQIMWVYLDDAEGFRKQLPKDTQDELLKGHRGEFEHFPNFLTFGQQKGKAAIEIALTMRQINLLAAFSEWIVLRHKDQIVDFLTRPMEPLVRTRKKVEFCTNQLNVEMGKAKGEN